jgi:peptidoglycan/xylan/chitin deacetylase (PgdA/CDA1 family)
VNRKSVERAVERALDGFGRALWHARLAKLVFRIGRRNPKVILYHACEPVESPFTRDLDVNTPPDEFAAQLDFLGRHYDVVPISALEGDRFPPGAAAVTFDDGYRSVLEHAAPLLEERGMPATVYLVTDVVGNDDLVWVNELNWLLVSYPAECGPVVTDLLGLPAGSTTGSIVASVLHDFDPVVVADLLAALWKAVPATRDALLEGLDLYLDWDEVRAMEGRGISFGSHTATHPNLRGLSADAVDDEVDRSVEAMRREVGHCRSFAFPFGFTNDQITSALRSRDFSSVMVVGGTNYGARSGHVARTPLTATTPAGMFAQLEVVEPVRAGLRRVVSAIRR